MKKLRVDKKSAVAIASNIIYPLIGLGLALAVWAVAAKVRGDALMLPTPAAVFKSLFSLGGEKGFWTAVGTSIGRTLASFCLSFVSALVLAAVAGMFRPLHRALSPIVSILRAAPTVAVILILYAFMDSDAMAIVVGFLIAFPIMYSSFYTAISTVDKDLIDMARLYKVRPLDRVTRIYLPCIADCLFDTSRATLSLTLKVVVAAEIITSIAHSIGGKIHAAAGYEELSYLLAWTMVAIIFSFALEWTVAALKKIREVAICRK